jgi:hypothetical protein
MIEQKRRRVEGVILLGCEKNREPDDRESDEEEARTRGRNRKQWRGETRQEIGGAKTPKEVQEAYCRRVEREAALRVAIRGIKGEAGGRKQWDTTIEEGARAIREARARIGRATADAAAGGRNPPSVEAMVGMCIDVACSSIGIMEVVIAIRSGRIPPEWEQGGREIRDKAEQRTARLEAAITEDWDGVAQATELYDTICNGAERARQRYARRADIPVGRSEVPDQLVQVKIQAAAVLRNGTRRVADSICTWRHLTDELRELKGQLDTIIRDNGIVL